METIRGVLRNHLRERPFDFYVAFLLFGVGAYTIVNDHWPESINSPFVQTAIAAISIYLIVASAIIMFSITCRRKKWPVLSLMGEMYGWLFVSAASIATVLLYLGAILGGVPSDWTSWIVMISIWLGLFIASGLRFLDLFNVYRSLKT